MVAKVHKIPSEPAGEGVTRKIIARGGTLMSVEVTFREGAVGAVHTHPHEQISYVTEGEFAYTIGEETHILEKGDSCYVAPNMPHGVKALRAGVLLDIFTPQREDFLK